jgi:hypothetical protein
MTFNPCLPGLDWMCEDMVGKAVSMPDSSIDDDSIFTGDELNTFNSPDSDTGDNPPTSLNTRVFDELKCKYANRYKMP